MNSSISLGNSGVIIGTIRLYMTHGDREDATPMIESKTPFVIGRATDCDMRLPTPDVSRRHARVQWRDGKWYINDLQSLNGVFVNGESVLESQLKTGDMVKIGSFNFRIGVEYIPAS